MCTINQDHMMYGFWDMKFNRQNFFAILGNFLPFCPNTLKNKKIKNLKKPWRYHHFTQVYQKSWSSAILFQRWRMTDAIVIFSLGYNFPFYLPNSPNNENFKTMKKNPGDIILHKCTTNHDHMFYCSWDMAHVGCNCYFSFTP